MPIKIIISIALLTLFLGCSEKQNPYAKPSDTLHEQSLMQTKKATLLNENNQTVAYVVGTYLNQIENSFLEPIEYEGREVFLVGIYEGEKSDSQLLKSLQFQINGNEIGCYSPLEKSDKLLEVIPSNNPWMQYYLLYAPNIQARTLQVSIIAHNQREVILSFYKDQL